jgi:hypothetical protein
LRAQSTKELHGRSGGCGVSSLHLSYAQLGLAPPIRAARAHSLGRVVTGGGGASQVLRGSGELRCVVGGGHLARAGKALVQVVKQVRSSEPDG